MRVSCVVGLVVCIWTTADAQSNASQGLTIHQAVEEALRNNLHLVAERYKVSVAEAELITARLRPNPVLSLGADHGDLLGTGFDDVNNAGPPEYFVRTDFVIERGGKRKHRIAVAEHAKSIAELQVLDATRKLIIDVEHAALDVLAAKSILALAEENLESINSVVNLNVLRVRAGDLSEGELLRTRLAALQFRNQVLERQSELRLARNRLQLLLGRSPGAPSVDVIGDFRREQLGPSIEELEQRALDLHPSIRGLRNEQARSIYDLRLQLATGKVDYTVGVEYRRQQGNAGKGNSLGFFFSMPLPVFNRNQGDVARAQREQQQIDAEIRALETEIQSEVRSAYEQHVTARELLETVEGDLLKQAREVRGITEYSYRRGEASLLEFLDAQRAFNETMETYYEARAAYARSLYSIEAATGEAITGKVQP